MRLKMHSLDAIMQSGLNSLTGRFYMQLNPFYIKGLSLMLVALMISGCSTVFGRHHDEQMITFDSNVSEVEILCSGKRVETPGSMPLRQSKSHSCKATKEGYESKAFRVRSGTSWSGFGQLAVE